jgi:hippurate hydrolase
MVGETPNIDRIGQEGAKFMTYYAEQSCTAGRNAFFTGMNPLRTGMIPPQLPGSPTYLRPGTPTIAWFLRDLGYNTGEFGKNHLGDHTDALPTAHGFHEFWGLKDQWHGTLMFIAQPAEEILSGAKAMLADGLFTRFPKPNFGFALHDAPFAYGDVLYRVGIGSSNADSLHIKFRGRGGHGAMPQATIDPVMMAARFVVDVQSVVSREKDPTEFGVVSIGAIHGGTAENIIPDDVILFGTIRTFKPEVRAKMLAGIERTAKAVATMSNAPEPEIKITEGAKAVINDPGVVGTTEKVLKAAFGDKFRPSPPSTPSEDYSEFINAGVPSMFFNIGVYEPERVAAAREGDGPQLPANHSPLFAPVPKPTIETGVEAMTLAVLSVFDQHARRK